MKQLMTMVAVAVLASATAFAHPIAATATTTSEKDARDAIVLEDLREIERNVAAITEHAAKLE